MCTDDGWHGPTWVSPSKSIFTNPTVKKASESQDEEKDKWEPKGHQKKIIYHKKKHFCCHVVFEQLACL